MRRVASAVLVAALPACLALVDTRGLTGESSDPRLDLSGSTDAFSDAADASFTDAAFDAGRDAPVTSYRQAILADQPLAYFRLGETSGNRAADATGRGNDGTYFGGGPAVAPGAIAGDSDTAVDFASGGMSAPGSLDFADRAPFSLEAWLLFTFVDGVYRHAFNKDTDPSGGAGRNQFGVYVRDAEGLIFERYVNGGEVKLVAPLPAANTYHHLVCTYDGSTLAIYVDGSLSSKTADDRSQPAKAVPLYVGAKGQTFQQWPGSLDEVAIYARALSSADVTRHYTLGRGL